MDIFVKDLYQDRNGKNKENVIEVFSQPVLDRFFRLMEMYFKLYYTELMIQKNINILGSFLERLYFHLSDESPEEKNVNGGFAEYRIFAKSTTLDKFFDSLEMFCFQISRGIETLRQRNRMRGNDELLDFLANANELFIRNSIPYRLQIDKTSGRTLVVKISDSEAVEETIQEFVRLISDKRFKGCQEKFIEAENCFAKNDFDGVMVKCNSLIEEMLCIILGKGSGTIANLIEEFLKKFDLPREFVRALKQFPEVIQHIRSTYPADVHGKNGEIDTKPVPEINEELAEYILSETAGLGRFIMKTYPKLSK